MNHYIISLFAVATLMVFQGCAAPSEPSSLKDSGTSSQTTSSNNNTGTAASTPTASSPASPAFSPGGAQLPLTIESKTVHDAVVKCLAGGFFFDRNKSVCTTYQLSKVSCIMPDIEGKMTISQKASFDSLMSGELLGYLLDQCLDCTTDNPFCRGASSTPLAPGARLHLVDPGSGSIKTVYIPGLR